MGFLMADTLLIDPMREDTVRLLDDLGEYAYAMAIVGDSYEHETTGQPDDPGTRHGMAYVGTTGSTVTSLPI